MYRDSRENAGLSRNGAALDLNVSVKSLQDYENGDTRCPADVAVRMGEVYQDPSLTFRHCGEKCAIGHKFSYVYLDNIDPSLCSVMLKLIEETGELHVKLAGIHRVIVNKKSVKDFTPEERLYFDDTVLEVLDVEHLAETFKETLTALGFDVPGYIQKHNRKCIEKGYVKRKTA